MAQSKDTSGVRYVWERSGVHVWFHYTTAEWAQAIATELRYVVSAHQNQKVGSGLYLGLGLRIAERKYLFSKELHEPKT